MWNAQTEYHSVEKVKCMRTEVSVDDFTKLIEGFATVLKNLDEARELMETSEIGTVLVHIGTFATMLKRFEIASDRIVAEVEGQIEDFKIGVESRHAMAKDIYQRYYKGKRRPKKD